MNTLKSVSNRLIRYFLAGVFAVLPLVVTIAIVSWVAGFLQRYVGPQTTIGTWVQNLGWHFTPGSKILAFIIGWAAVLAIVFLLGVTASQFMNQNLVDAQE